MNNTSPLLGIVALLGFLFLVFLPVVVIASKGRLALQIAALLLCFLAVAALVATTVAAGTAPSGLTFMLTLPISGSLWFAGMICALAAWIDASQERRDREMTLRLLMNESRGLGKLPD